MTFTAAALLMLAIVVLAGLAGVILTTILAGLWIIKRL